MGAARSEAPATDLATAKTLVDLQPGVRDPTRGLVQGAESCASPLGERLPSEQRDGLGVHARRDFQRRRAGASRLGLTRSIGHEHPVLVRTVRVAQLETGERPAQVVDGDARLAELGEVDRPPRQDGAPAPTAGRSVTAARTPAACVKLRTCELSRGAGKATRFTLPQGVDTRPTGDRVREAAFNLIGPVDGASVLDLFAGSGAMGLEALSRGAERAVFVESERAACRAIERNLEKLRLTGARVVCDDVLALPRDGPRPLRPRPRRPALRLA